jgi:SMI1 / KNR4 family (SUKH-1)
MPARRVNVAGIRQKLFSAPGGIEAHDQVRRLLRAEPSESMPVLRDYSANGAIDHVRTHTCALLADLIDEGDRSFAAFFEAGLSDPALAYWSVKGLARSAGKSSYQVLTSFALDPAHRAEGRGRAVRELALLSGQHFAEGLPADPGQWTEGDLPIEQLQRWAADGYPDGVGFSPPERSPRLDSPQNPVDEVASRLDQKLARLRAQRQDPMNPSNWLTPASAADLAAIEARWHLPSTYIAFLRDFSPVKVTIDSRRYYQGLELYGAAALPAAQYGYSFNPKTKEVIDDWPPEYVVIANHAGDPYVLDLAHVSQGDAPVLTAGHDEPPVLIGDQLRGGWRFRKEAPTFLAFLEKLAG